MLSRKEEQYLVILVLVCTGTFATGLWPFVAPSPDPLGVSPIRTHGVKACGRL